MPVLMCMLFCACFHVLVARFLLCSLRFLLYWVKQRARQGQSQSHEGTEICAAEEQEAPHAKVKIDKKRFSS